MKKKYLHTRIAVLGIVMYILGLCIPMTLADTGTIDGAPTPCGLEAGRLADCLKPTNAPDFKSQLDLESGFATDNIKQVISLIAGGVAALAGTAAILFIVIHGLRLATAGADEGRRTEAMKSIQWTILGLILVIFAYVVVLVVLDVVTTVGSTRTTSDQQDIVDRGTVENSITADEGDGMEQPLRSPEVPLNHNQLDNGMTTTSGSEPVPGSDIQ